MARIIARRDSAARYVYIKSGDAFAVPPDCRDLIKRRGAEFSPDIKEWRVHINQGPDLVAIMRSYGHDVITVDGGTCKPGMKECASCGQPYSADFPPDNFDPQRIVGPGEPCWGCGAPLELAETHKCDHRCQDLAARRAS